MAALIRNKCRALPCLGCVLLIQSLLSASTVCPQETPSRKTVDHKAIEQPFVEFLNETSGDGSRTGKVSLHSRRGDAYFFTGQYAKAVREYEKMVDVDASLDASHWRLGIALFFANRPKTAVAQFEKYHSFDDVDRENGIWRYLSQYRATDATTAKKELLKYRKDDREPFPAVYRLFDDTLTPDDALALIGDDLPKSERDKRLFYTELYIGMHKVVQGQDAEAIRFLKLAVSRKWPQDAGGGPRYMWHVGRVQLKDLIKKKSDGDHTKPDQERQP